MNQTQEVRVILQLTLDVDATLSKEDIDRAVREGTEFAFEMDKYDNIDVQMVDIIEIKEEAEIYGNE